MSSIPVFLLTGFLGAGKTTLLNYILHHQTMNKIAVIKNEYGNGNTDAQFLSHHGDIHITTLKNGCICCNSNAELSFTLFELLEQKDKKLLDFDLLIIECTGIADPGPIIKVFLTHDLFSERFTLRGVITLIDAVNIAYQLKHFNVVQAQIGYADLLLISKSDLLSYDASSLLTQLHNMNQKAAIYSIIHGNIDLNLIYNLDGFSLTPPSKPTLSFKIDDHEDHKVDVRSFTITRYDPFEINAISSLMERILTTFNQQLLRYKGILYIKNHSEKLLLQGVQQIYNSTWGQEWKSTETPYSEIVFIGIQLPEEEFKCAFQKL
ncbi:GTP-binding protein [Commensalibacter oyaizuii]|uniref:GTP-binding protein n=1 Tax=Commensalibacter oyaizuii TaxID=3043873 RepID=A0ABT6PYH2_9PROT|nr:GTP-binding protein [Commensalibacter sp. TBRC 16381]MDI2089910.1 GTP-binding protein [Commensalibacter sp. TBRC 16381]